METHSKQAHGHATVLDVNEEPVARVYAEGFLGAANQAGNAEVALEHLSAIVEEALDKFPRFGETLQSHFLSHDEREELIDRVFGGKVDAVVINTLKVMSKHNRLGLMRTMTQVAHDLFDKQQGRMPVEVTSASPLSDEVTKELADMVRTKLNVEPMLRTAVDPDLIAGLLIRVGDKVYDGSLRTVLAKTRQSIIDKTVAKIEQNPEHFLSSSK